MGSSATDFHFVVSLEWLGQSGKVEPAGITISEPQHTLVYAPKMRLISPLKGKLYLQKMSVRLQTQDHMEPRCFKGVTEELPCT
jgi:hypothetical protein